MDIMLSSGPCCNPSVLILEQFRQNQEGGGRSWADRRGRSIQGQGADPDSGFKGVVADSGLGCVGGDPRFDPSCSFRGSRVRVSADPVLGLWCIQNMKSSGIRPSADPPMDAEYWMQGEPEPKPTRYDPGERADLGRPK